MPYLKSTSTAALLLSTTFASGYRIRHSRDESIASPWTWSNSSGSTATDTSTPAVPTNPIVFQTPSSTLLGTAISPALFPTSPQIVRGNRSHHGIVGVFPQNQTAAGNGSNNSACTINISGATIEKWYTSEFIWPTLYFTPQLIDSSLTYAINKADEFNVTTALSWALGLAVVTTMSWNTDLSSSVIQFIPTTASGPIAAATSVLSISQFSPVPTGPLTEPDLVESLALNITTPPTVTITGPSNTAYIAPSGTPFVQFSQYQVERLETATDALGSVVYTRATKTYNISDTFAFDYRGNTLDDLSTATGDVPTNFIAQIPDSTCVPGTYTGSVTVLFVVNIVYSLHARGNMVHLESSVGPLVPPGPQSKANIETSAPVEAPQPLPPAPTSAHQTGLTGNEIAALLALFQHFAVNIAHVESSVAKVDFPSLVLMGTETSDAEADSPPAPTAANGNGASQNGGSGSQNAQHRGQDGPGSDSPSPVIVIGGDSFAMGSSSAFVIGQQTLAPGGPAIAVGGTTISLAPSATAVVVNGVSSPLPDAAKAAPNPPIITVGSNAYTANAATQYYLGPGQILTPGGAANVEGTVVSLGPSASYVVVGGSTQAFQSAMITAAPAIAAGEFFAIGGQALAPGGNVVLGGTTISLDSGGSTLVVNGYSGALGGIAANQPVISAAGSNYAAVDGTSFVIGGQTLTPGGRITAAGTTLSLDASDQSIYVNGVPSAISKGYPFSTLYPAITFQGTTIAPNAQSVGSSPTYTIGGATLTPGGRVVVSGTTLSLAPFATALIINGATSTLNPAVLTSLPAIPLGSTSLSPILGPGRTYVIGSQTLTPGGRITVFGTTLSLLSTPTAVVINGATYALSALPASAAAPAPTNAPLLTFAGHTYTALSGGSGAQPTYIIGSQTLTAGGSIVLGSGTTISLAPLATALVINGATTPLFPATATAAAAASNTRSKRPELTIGASTYTALPAGSPGAVPTFVINGVTLAPGGTVVLGPGSTVVLQTASDGAAVAVVAGVTTETFATGPTHTGASATAEAAAGATETGKGKGKKSVAAAAAAEAWVVVLGLWGFMGGVFWLL
ncbi:hypothetical protein BKA81DRAFT_416251 [Phyllosticta paracitricarpa]|uniref:Uncharacterized protein n=1 Tax=Phyllosticta paracitricarpa TaxID=2016321 RepID=A0ABR1NEK1_9PEZI